MSNIAGWLGSGAAIVVIVVCFLVEQHMAKLPSMAHSWIRRGLIALMFCAGATLVVTPLGGYALDGLDWVAGIFGGVSYPGLGWAALVSVGLYVITYVAVRFLFAPDQSAAYYAAVLPIVLALSTGGVLHHLYLSTVSPGQDVTQTIAHWLGG